MLRVDHVRKTFGNLVAVDDVEFEIGVGEIVGLLGPNGAGKTTLFNVITGVYRADGGSITLRGDDITQVDPYKVTQKGIGRTFQIVRTFNETSVLDNVANGILFGRDGSKNVERAREKAREYLAFVGLAEEADTITKNLTVADRRKVEIARALATEPAIILLDEPASGLNPAEIEELSETIKSIRDEYGVSILWIEHIMDAIMGTVDRIIVLHHGKKIADGTPAKIRSDKQVSEAYLGETL